MEISNERRQKKEEVELVCQECGSKKNVSTDFDPYAQEIGGKDIEVTLCEECFTESIMDI